MKSCLLIVDVQKGFINEHTKHIPLRVEALQKDYSDLFVSRFVNPPDSSFRNFMNWGKFAAGSEDAELAFIPRFDARIFEKNVYSCVNEHFLRQLKDREISDISLCGIDTDCCILKTAVDLFERNYRPVILSAVCASHAGKEYHEAGLKILRRLVGEKQII